MKPQRILVADDDPKLARLLELQLKAFDYEVVIAHDGRTALELAHSGAPDLIILDIGLPVVDGLAVCRELRQTSSLPILMLSAHREDYDKIVGLELGADDYVGKPCNPRELLARVRALLRRCDSSSSANAEEDGVNRAGSLTISSLSHEAWDGGRKLPLTPIEFSLLESLVASHGRTLSRQVLLEKIWGSDFVGSSRTVDSHVRNLRRKLQGSAMRIEAVRSVGFKLVEANGL